MWKNVLKVAARALRRHKGYAALNVAGLALGMACCALILLYVTDELGYDRFHEHADRIYRVTSHLEGDDRPAMHLAASPVALGPVLEQDYPAVERAVRILQAGATVARDARSFYEERFFFADSAFFDVFTFPLARGDARTALAEPLSLVLTEAAARKYFGDDDPVGQALTVDGEATFTVTGVLAPIPSNSHLRFDFLASFASLEAMDRWPEYPWWTFSYFTYVLTAESADAQALGDGVYDIATRYVADQEAQYGTRQRYALQPLTDIYLHSEAQRDIGPAGSVGVVTTFAVIALLILVIACVNFMNLSTARAADRAAEVGVRKVLGARRAQLARQFLGESFLVALVALGLAVVLIALALPGFNALAGKAFGVGVLGRPSLLAGLVGITVVVGFVAGSYPAFVLSGFPSIDALKGLRAGPKGGRLRRGLVVFQFATSVALIVATMVVFEQLSFMRTQDLGFEKEQVVVLPIRGDEELASRYESVKTALRQAPGVREVAASNEVPGRDLPAIVFVPEGADETETQAMLTITADYDFLDTYGIELAAGRGFSPEFGTDADEAFLLNEAAVAHLGWGTPAEAVGKQFTWGWPGKAGRVVGVVKDFHQTSLQRRVEPVVLHIQPSWFDYFSVRIQTADVAGTMEALEEVWTGLAPGRPFEAFFLDADYDRQYRAEERLGGLFGVFAGLAVVIACLGLFGLAAFTVRQRTKEIGIRKVVGASTPGIVLLLSKEFVVLVGVAFVVACPVAYLAMDRWLEGFAYRISPGVEAFALAGGLAVAIALATVSVQAVRAALADPVESLRYE